VFTLSRPTAAVIEEQIAAAKNLPAAASPILSLTGGTIVSLTGGTILSLTSRMTGRIDLGKRLPFGFAHDQSCSQLGQGHPAFVTARKSFQNWAMFNLGWVRVANPEAPIALGQIVAVEVHALGLWSLNLSRIAEVVDTPTQLGFLYVTTALHVEEGEERFLLEFDAATGNVWYQLEAISRPRNALARLGYPITRAFQHKFARDSHRSMRNAVLSDAAVLS
jgi:uncharacterized protein (UPF0548 family)